MLIFFRRAVALYFVPTKPRKVVKKMLMTNLDVLRYMTLPAIQIVAPNLAQGWEEAVLATWQYGAQIATQYDKPGDPLSRDCMLMLSVADPFAEPRIHRALICGFDGLESYRQEVVDGIHDHWIDRTLGSTKWRYTYHERWAAYALPGAPEPFNQIDSVVNELIKAPYTRRAIAMTWQPWFDPGSDDPPCAQYLWFRIFDDRLVANLHIRSNDAYKAAFMNMYAFTDLQRHVAERVSEGLGREIKVGQYNHVVDSFHIYGSYFEQFEGFLKLMGDRPDFADRTYRSDDPTFVEIIDEAREKIAASLVREKEADK